MSLTLEQRTALAKDHKTSFDVLEGLLKDEEWAVRYWALMNPNIPGEYLAAFTHSKFLEIRMTVALNPSLPLKVVEVFLKDAQRVVRRNAASSVQLPVKRLLTLCKSNDSNIRHGVAMNTACPFDVLVSLLEDENAVVSSAARVTLGNMSPKVFNQKMEESSYREFKGLPSEWVLRTLTRGDIEL